MEHRYDIKSKLYVKPSKGRFAFRIALLVALILILLSGIISIIMEGLKIGTLGYMAIAFIVVSGYIKRPSTNPHYESTFATVVISDEDVQIEYKQLGGRYDNLIWTIKYNDISSLEYSDQLSCLRIVGKVLLIEKETGDVKECKQEHFLYLEEGKEQIILNDLIEVSHLNVDYLDR